jgi:hypothetical protein
MAITKYSDISSFIAAIYERSVFVAREMNLMSNLVSNYSAQGWMTRTFSTRPEITAESVADGVDYSNPTTFGKSSVGTLTPAEAIAQVILTDQDIETDPDGAMNDASYELGAAIAAKIDTDLTAIFSSFSTDKGPGAGSTNTIADLASGVAVVRNRMKRAGPVNAVLHPYQWHDIWAALGQPAGTYPAIQDVANQAMRDYYVSSLLTLSIYTSSNVPISGTDATGGVFNQDAIALDTRRPYRLEPERDASLRGTELNATAGYAVGLGKRPTFGVKFIGDITEPT